jgi:hypothetical protein
MRVNLRVIQNELEGRLLLARSVYQDWHKRLVANIDELRIRLNNVYREWALVADLPFAFLSPYVKNEGERRYGVSLEECPFGFMSVNPLEVAADRAFSVLSLFRLDGTALIGGAIDLVSGTYFLANSEDGVLLKEGNSPSRSASPRAELSLNGEVRQITLATNKWDPGFAWDERVEKALTRRFKTLRYWPYSGSHVYALLSTGDIHGYVMLADPGEKRPSIDAGFAFAKLAKCPVVVVRTDGKRVWRFHYRPRAGSEKLVGGTLVAACNEEMLNDIIERIIREEVLQL